MAFTLLLDDRWFFFFRKSEIYESVNKKKKSLQSPRLKFSRIKTDGLSLLKTDFCSKGLFLDLKRSAQI